MFSLCFFCHLQIFRSCEWFTLYLWTQHVFFAKSWGALRSSTYSIALGPPRKVLADSTVATWRPDGWEDVGKWSKVFAGDTFNTCLGPSENFSTVQFVSLNRVARWILGGLETMRIQKVDLFTCVCFCGWCFLTDFTWITIKNPPSREYICFFRTSTSKLAKTQGSCSHFTYYVSFGWSSKSLIWFTRK